MANWQIFNADIIEWCKSYEGPKFHAVLADCPYGLTTITNRFGKEGSAPAQFGEDGLFQRASKGFMGMCYHPDTEVLTENGWIKIVEIVSNQYSGRIYSLNPDTFDVEFANIVDYQEFKYSGNLYHFTGRSVDLLVTPNHNLFIGDRNKPRRWTFVRADESPSVFRMANYGKGWAGINLDSHICIGKSVYPIAPFMRFVGIFLGDGCVVHRKAQPWKQDFIAISATKERKKLHVKSILDNLGIKYSQYPRQTLVYDKDLMGFLETLGSNALDKHIPDEVFLYPDYVLQELWIGLLETDGYTNGSTCVQYATASKRLADDVQRLALLIGKSCTIGMKDEGKS